MITQQWDDPTTSYRLISEVASPPSSVVDVGGGASQLVDRLLENGFRDITVVDQSQDELTAAYERVGSAPVTWTATDINQWVPERTFDVWHDRATYDELSDPDEQQHYWDLVRTAVDIGGHVVIATKDLPGLTLTMGEGFTVSKADERERVEAVGLPETYTWLVAQRV